MRTFEPATFCLLALAVAGCRGARPSDALDAQDASPVIGPVSDCETPPGDHFVFVVQIDGLAVGREVRSRLATRGPYGDETLHVSHTVTRMKVEGVQIENRAARLERTRADTGQLLHASHVSEDALTARAFVVGFDGERWSRRVDVEPAAEDTSSVVTPLALNGDEVVGLALSHHMREVAAGRRDAPVRVSFYEPLLDAPIVLELAKPLRGEIEVDGQRIVGSWVEASDAETGEIRSRAFFDVRGTLWQEEFPALRQVRRLSPGGLSFGDETSELLVGLRSESYLAMPEAATRAVFRLVSTPDRLDGLGLLAEPANQRLTRDDPRTLTLEVRAGAPDGSNPPTPEDLGSDRTIRPDAREIREALRYLRSGGRQGRLSKPRRDNATPVVARASLIASPSRFWSDPDQVAGLVMHYVSALLPDKRHTFSMSDAVSTLERGAGDCTEHSVLFASLMRAAGIPTRLVVGVMLMRGGIWGYHMWNEYWDGSSWQSIDPSTMAYRTGALHVAVGRGVSEFGKIRKDIAKFIWNTFSGVEMDLVEASSEGEPLVLARPRSPHVDDPEMALFAAMVLADRGDFDGAIAILDEKIPAEGRPLQIRLVRLELLARAERYDEALVSIAGLRGETSAGENTRLLDRIELDCLIASGRIDQAETLYRSLLASMERDPAGRAVLESRMLSSRGEADSAIEILEKALSADPSEPRLLSALAEEIARQGESARPETVHRGLNAIDRLVTEDHATDPGTLTTWARLLALANRWTEAAWILDHGLLIAPADRVAKHLTVSLSSRRCPH